MRSLPLLAVALVAASASAASAGTYLGLGIGTAASPGGDVAAMSSDGNRSGRLILGTRFGRLSIEGAASRYSLFNRSLAIPYDGTMLAGALKYSLPLGNNFELFGRGGVQRTWLTTDAQAREWSGNGWLLGAGFEYRLNLGLTGASLFVDYEHSSSTLETSSQMSLKQDATIGLWTAGVTLAI